MFTTEAIRKRFHELTAEREKIDAPLSLLRAELNALVAGEVDMNLLEARAREATLREDIKKLQNELFPIDQERANCARALKNQVGAPS